MAAASRGCRGGQRHPHVCEGPRPGELAYHSGQRPLPAHWTQRGPRHSMARRLYGCQQRLWPGLRVRRGRGGEAAPAGAGGGRLTPRAGTGGTTRPATPAGGAVPAPPCRARPAPGAGGWRGEAAPCACALAAGWGGGACVLRARGAGLALTLVTAPLRGRALLRPPPSPPPPRRHAGRGRSVPQEVTGEVGQGVCGGETTVVGPRRGRLGGGWKGAVGLRRGRLWWGLGVGLWDRGAAGCREGWRVPGCGVGDRCCRLGGWEVMVWGSAREQRLWG